MYFRRCLCTFCTRYTRQELFTLWYVMQFGNTCIRHSFNCFFFFVPSYKMFKNVHSFVPKTNKILKASERWFVIQPRKTNGEQRHRSDDGVTCKMRDTHKTACCPIHITGAALCCAVPTIRADGWWYNERNKYFYRTFAYYDNLRVLVQRQTFLVSVVRLWCVVLGRQQKQRCNDILDYDRYTRCTR